jgi:deoxyadenosine kinase
METTSIKPFIALAGLIGAGKTTLSRQLSEKMGLPLFEEPVANNAVLKDFYKDMKQHGFHLQVHLLNIRFQQHQKIVWDSNGGVSDRSIYEDGIFAKHLNKAGLMSDKEYHTYTELFQNMSNFLKRPTVIIYLDVSPEESVERIKTRGRDMETGITLDYMQGLHEGYEEFIQDISKSVPVIRVPWHEFQDVEDIVNKLMQQMQQMHNVVALE